MLVSSSEGILDLDDPLALDDLADMDGTGDLRKYSRILRHPRLEELSDTGKTTGDVLRLLAGLRELGQDASDADMVHLGDLEVGSTGQEVGVLGTVLALDDDPRLEALEVVLGDLALDVSSLLVDLVDEGRTLLDVCEEDLSGMLGDDRLAEGVELDEGLAGLDDLVVSDAQLAAGGQKQPGVGGITEF